MASYLSPRSPRETRRRTASLLLAVAAHLLVIWLLLRLSPTITMREPQQPGLTTFNVSPDQGSKPKAEKRERTLAKTSSAKAAARPKVERQQAAEQPPAPTPPVDLHLFGHNSPLAGADIGKLPSHADSGEVADSGAGTGRNSGSVYGPGAGPGGAKMYNVDWVRRPTHAEISGYMPPGGAPEGAWAEIACKTIPGNQVDNCRSLGESPAGSGLARGLRLAAWQFRIYPPRIDDRPLLGVWVRIHLDFTARAREAD